MTPKTPRLAFANLGHCAYMFKAASILPQENQLAQADLYDSLRREPQGIPLREIGVGSYLDPEGVTAGPNLIVAAFDVSDSAFYTPDDPDGL